MHGDVVELTQRGLTDKILKTVGMDASNANETPAKEAPLHSDQNGKPFNENWDMASVVGMLMYLVHTRPDIQFAVHQCAKYTHHPKDCHAKAVKKICRYLAGTRNRGLCFKTNPTDPSQPLRVDCYVDASFAPLWNVEDPMNPDGAKSRSGYVIRIDDCPIAFSSRKQGETAMSTTEAEYMALSMAMRELLWVRRMVREVAEWFGIAYDKRSRILSKVFEDNQGAIAVAKRPDLTARTRHLHTKYHHFKENIGVDEQGDGIELVYIDTKEQIADMFTKGLGNENFMRLRDELMGWNLQKNRENQNQVGFKGELKYCDVDERGRTNRSETMTDEPVSLSGTSRGNGRQRDCGSQSVTPSPNSTGHSSQRRESFRSQIQK